MRYLTGDAWRAAHPARGRARRESHGEWKGDDIGYLTLHKRLYSQLGKASDHTCTCGAPATDWAYDHADPNERTGTGRHEGKPYSLDLEHYAPLCRSCHTKRDRYAMAVA